MPTLSPVTVNNLPQVSPTQTIKHYFPCLILVNMHIYPLAKKKIFDKICPKMYDYIILSYSN